MIAAGLVMMMVCESAEGLCGSTYLEELTLCWRRRRGPRGVHRIVLEEAGAERRLYRYG